MTSTDLHPRSATSAAHNRWAVASWFGPGEPHAVRGPFARWPRVADGLLALLVFAGSLVAVTASVIDDGEDFDPTVIGDRPVGVVALLALAAVALWWRRAHPTRVVAGELALLVVWALAGYGDGQDLALVVAVYSVGRYSSNARHSVVAVAAASLVSIAGTVIDANQRVDVVPAVVLAIVPWYVGRRIRNRGEYLALLRERAERREADQQARTRQAVAAERSRIARELHDVVAHRVSMMTVQAGAAKTIAGHDLGGAVEAMADVERAGRQALGELRHLLDVLRPDTADADHLGPQPGLADVPALVGELAHTGADVTLTMADRPDDLAAAVDLSAYRIIQECITNVVKHAGPEPTVDIRVCIEGGRLDLVITNSAVVASPGLPTSGHGITGMRERASLLGGTLTAGPLPPDRFRVHARLPLQPEPDR